MAQIHTDRKRLLFLTTYEPEDGQHWNEQLVADLSGFSRATLRSWRSGHVDAEYIASNFTHVFLLTVGYYDEHIETFHDFVSGTLSSIATLSPSIRIFNSPSLTMWNSNKTYLADLEHAGFRTPQTIFLKLPQSLQTLQSSLLSAASLFKLPVVIKLSIGASGKNVHRITELSDGRVDASLLDFFTSLPSGRAQIMVQEYVHEVVHAGEWSLIYVNRAYVCGFLKRVTNEPDRDEFRINTRFGGRLELVDDSDIPPAAKKVAADAVAWLEAKFGDNSCGYIRVDGVHRAGGQFTIMGEANCNQQAPL